MSRRTQLEQVAAPSMNEPRGTVDTRRANARSGSKKCFGWLKTIAVMRKVRHRGLANVGWVFTLAAAAYNLVRMRKLLASPVGAQ